MFIENKYKVWHDNIIANAQLRVLDCYKEKHHILPRCLGGNNKKENLVELTAKEHFIVHMLLCKFTTGNAYYKMLYAFKSMCQLINNNHKRDYKITSRIAENLRLKAEKNNPVYRDDVKAKISKANKGKKRTKETRLKMSKARMGNKNALGLVHSQEFINKIKKINTGNSNALGRKFVNKNGKSITVKDNEVEKYLKQGYKLGMDISYMTKEYINKKSMASKGNTNLKGRISVYKGKTNKYIYIVDFEKYIKLGFKKGRNKYYTNNAIKNKILKTKKQYDVPTGYTALSTKGLNL
jgi:hypothetical protein